MQRHIQHWAKDSEQRQAKQNTPQKTKETMNTDPIKQTKNSRSEPN